MNKEITMNKETALNTLTAIYSSLQSIPVYGDQNVAMMTGVFNALKNVAAWVDGVAEDEGTKGVSK